ncbi:signal peptide peptidase-like 2B [Tachypleus tridentatus]|uniref:signal peptide peptidase-like 2B n=1 Tax=Tachypleus tridentatus TaxID=6853 RepID=UPI003FD34F40
MNVSPVLVAVFVLCMGAMLLLLYFFYDYLVYFIISLFVLASIISVYNCVEPSVKRLSIGTYRLPNCNFLCCKGSLQVYQVVVLLFAVTLAVTWVIIRKESYSWILQDILGVAFSINMLKSIRLPSLKICAILLVLLFFYDIFFVFITPFLTAKGESVMVEVATGGSSQEVIGPMCEYLLSQIGPMCEYLLSQIGPMCECLLSQIGPMCECLLSQIGPMCECLLSQIGLMCEYLLSQVGLICEYLLSQIGPMCEYLLSQIGLMCEYLLSQIGPMCEYLLSQIDPMCEYLL